jgi:tetratricopeptide (TPR) repeat protein
MNMLSSLLLLAGVSIADSGAHPPVIIHSGRLSVRAVDSAPARPETVDAATIERLRQSVADAPRDRDARLALVQGLVDAGRPEDALAEAKAWREVDAYNLVVVRMIGDLLAELGREGEALRVYSAVPELLPEDPEAQRALATVLKQQGDLSAAATRLKVAAELRPEDARTRFELADVSLRMGDRDAALQLLRGVVDAEDAPEALRYPARQRLAQVYVGQRRDAKAAGDATAAGELDGKIEALEVKGGVDNDIKIYLSWDTDRTDVDLWVTNPAGEKVFYSHRKGRYGGALFDDVTTGYGPESFTAHAAHVGTYEVTVDFFGTSRDAFKEARGEVIVVLNEGRDDEVQQTFPYRLYRPKQHVTVAKIEVRK